MLNVNFWIGIITIYIILITLVCSRQVIIYDQMINGFYDADSSFCEESGIDMFSLFLDNDVYGSTGYILMTKNGDFILNDPVTIKLYMHQLNWNNWTLDPTKEKVFTIEFTGIDEDLEDIFPKKQLLKFYPILGKIVMYNKDTITAVMYKSGINSEIKNTINSIESINDIDVE